MYCSMITVSNSVKDQQTVHSCAKHKLLPESKYLSIAFTQSWPEEAIPDSYDSVTQTRKPVLH